MKADDIFLRIADIDFRIVSVDHGLTLKVDGADSKFFTPKTIPHVTIKAYRDDLSRIEPEEKVFDSGSVWQLYRKNGTFLFYLKSSAFGPIPYKLAKVSKDFTKIEVVLHRPYFHSGQPVSPLEYPLDELLLINLLSLGRGVEVHACGVVDRSGYGHLFIGQSGAGKTTMARLWQETPGVTILSDDRIVLREIGDKLWMYGTPWHGEAMLASPERAPLRGIYFLEKGVKNELIPLRNSVALGRLITSSFIPFYSQPGLTFTLSFFEEVVKAVPCQELRFVPDNRLVEFINERQV